MLLLSLIKEDDVQAFWSILNTRSSYVVSFISLGCLVPIEGKGWVYLRADMNNLEIGRGGGSLSPSCIPTTIPYHPIRLVT